MLTLSLSGLPPFLLYFTSGAVLLLLFSFIYTLLTPHSELPLIRKGNIAAAVAYGGALLGYTLPLASAIAHSVSFVDMLIWSGIGLVIQLSVLGIVRLAVPSLFLDMENGMVAPAVLLATISFAAGIINAASMTY